MPRDLLAVAVAAAHDRAGCGAAGRIEPEGEHSKMRKSTRWAVGLSPEGAEEVVRVFGTDPGCELLPAAKRPKKGAAKAVPLYAKEGNGQFFSCQIVRSRSSSVDGIVWIHAHDASTRVFGVGRHPYVGGHRSKRLVHSYKQS